jgi:Flp pilus assembly protein CpaB
MAFTSDLFAQLRRSRPTDSWHPNAVVKALRRPGIYWSLAALLTIATLWIVNDLTSSARATLESYGARDNVLVVTDPIAPGDSLGPHNVALRPVPSAHVPSGAVTLLPDESVARIDLFPGEVVVESRLAGGGSGLAALVPRGSMALAVPAGTALPPLVVGDLVEVIATFAVAPQQAGEPSFAVARSAAVIHVTDQAVTVAVTREEASPVAFALAHGAVTLALVG